MFSSELKFVTKLKKLSDFHREIFHKNDKLTITRWRSLVIRFMNTQTTMEWKYTLLHIVIVSQKYFIQTQAEVFVLYILSFGSTDSHKLAPEVGTRYFVCIMFAK